MIVQSSLHVPYLAQCLFGDFRAGGRSRPFRQQHAAPLIPTKYAGLVWRYRDPQNYYVTRCNALEDNCTIYRVIGGRRQDVQNHRVKVSSNTWHSLRVEAGSDRFVVTYDGNKVLDARDATFKDPDPGRVGLWTKADSIIYFDNFSATAKS